MHSSIAIAALLGAGALAHPSFQHRNVHLKRDTVVTTTIGNEVVVEDIKNVYVTVVAGQGGPVLKNLAVAAPAATTTSVSAPVVHEEYHQRPANKQVLQVADSPQIVPAAQPAPSTTLVVQASPTSTPAAAGPSTPASPPPESGTFWTTSPMSPLAGGAGAKDILTQANHWRQLWKGLPPFTWSATLAENAYKTAMNDEFKTASTNPADLMIHHLYPGSNAQCEAEPNVSTVQANGNTPFDAAFLMWICEEPTSGVPCDSIMQPGGNDIGHAEIIKGSVSQIGCYYREAGPSNTGIWTCDFAS